MAASSICIKQYSFSVKAPYREGSVLSETEAQALNALRAENIRNNVSKWIIEAQSRCGKGLLPQQVVDEIRKRIRDYDRDYTFQPKTERKRLGAIEVEALSLAVSIAGTAARKEGRDDSEEALREEIELLSQSLEIIAEARAIVEEKQRIAQEGLEGLL